MIDPDIDSLRLPLATKQRMQRDRARRHAADHARRFGITPVRALPLFRGQREETTFHTLLDAGVPVIDIAKWHGVTVEDVEVALMQ